MTKQFNDVKEEKNMKEMEKKTESIGRNSRIRQKDFIALDRPTNVWSSSSLFGQSDSHLVDAECDSMRNSERKWLEHRTIHINNDVFMNEINK